MKNGLKSLLFLCFFTLFGSSSLVLAQEAGHNHDAGHDHGGGSKDHANSSTSSIEVIFNWAENNHPDIFTSQQPTLIHESWRYRDYPADILIGVDDDKVYGRGGPWDTENPVYIDSVYNLLSLIFPEEHGFISSGCTITEFAVNLPADAQSKLDCEMRAWLNEDGSALKYRIKVSGMEFINSNGDVQDDISGIHVHNHTENLPENPKGPHVLNAFASPAFDDSDVVVRPAQGIIEGIWSDIDENLSFGEPHNSHQLSGLLNELCTGKIFAAAHGTFEDSPGHFAPYVKMILNPTSQGEQICRDLGHL